MAAPGPQPGVCKRAAGKATGNKVTRLLADSFNPTEKTVDVLNVAIAELEVELIDSTCPPILFRGLVRTHAACARARPFLERCLSRDLQRVPSVHRGLAFDRSRFASVPSERSISRACCPIVVCSPTRLNPSWFAGLPEENTSPAYLDMNHLSCVNWFGCASKRPLNCASVSCHLGCLPSQQSP